MSQDVKIREDASLMEQTPVNLVQIVDNTSKNNRGHIFLKIMENHIVTIHFQPKSFVR